MKKNVVPDTVVYGSACADLAKRTRAARKTWTALDNILQACFINSGEPKEFVLDPFALLHAIANARSQAIVVAQVGEPLLVETENRARQAAQSATLAFDGELRNLCMQEKISVAGRFPTYVLDGYLNLRLFPDEGACRIGTKKVKSLFARRIWFEIASAVKGEKLRQVAPDEFLVSCQMAYKRIVALRNEKVGISIPIRDLLRELQITRQHEKSLLNPLPQRLSAYTEAHFSRDVARLMAAGHFVARDGAKIELMPTAFSKDGIPVNVGEGVRYIGRVIFGEPSR